LRRLVPAASAELDELLGGPFATVFDVGGNVGDFAELAHAAWPGAHVHSFEPVHALAEQNRGRAGGRWRVHGYAISDRPGQLTLHYCENQHPASTLQQPGTIRREAFGIRDHYRDLQVAAEPLDRWLERVREPLLLKIDVEGHEGRVLAGARRVLERAAAVLCEVQNVPGIFGGAPRPWEIDAALRSHGLSFAGLGASLCSPQGRLLQFDGIWRRLPQAG
jgi:FkbM family methyltransferase